MKIDFKIAAVILIIFAIVVGFIIIGGDSIGLTDADARTMLSILPGVAVLLLDSYLYYIIMTIGNIMIK